MIRVNGVELSCCRRGSLNVNYTVEVDNTTEAAGEAVGAIVDLGTGKETIEVLGQNTSASSISVDGVVGM